MIGLTCIKVYGVTWRRTKIPHSQWCPLRGSSSPLTPLSRRGLHPIQLAYNPCRSDGWLKLTAIAFNRLKPVCQQSWQQGPLVHRTRRFYPNDGRNHRQYSLYLPR